jgi:ABC-type sugar transport system ATPase subunit
VGSPQEVYRRPASKFVAEFLGDVNWMQGVGVRPEAIHVSRQRPVGIPQTAPAVVQTCSFLGNCIHLRTTLHNGVPCIAELPRQFCDFQSGEQVHVWWHPDDEFRLGPL